MTINNKYSPLFKPCKIGKLKLKNRISMPPMYTKYADSTGEVNDKVIEYFVRRALGGVGLIILENTCVDWEYGKAPGNPITIHHERFLPKLNELVNEVHKYGVKIMPELHHAGRQQICSNIDGRQPLAPSPIKSKVGGDMPKEMTLEEIDTAIQRFVDSAKRAKKCGFDGIELHGAHGYLIASFISPLTNKRTDKYGGSFENRCRFAVELVTRIRKEVGKDFPIVFRLSGEEWTPNSLTLSESVKYAQVLEDVGVDALDVSGGYYESIVGSPMQGQPFDHMIYMAEAIKKVVNIPVLGCGSLGFDPDTALNIVKKGKADLIHFGRSLLADPDLPNKIKEGKLDEIKNCIRCNECLGCLDKDRGISCAVNPQLGREYKDIYRNTKSIDSKRIVVVGAGPCGLELAINAAKKGHKVTILEKNNFIGGLVNYAATPNYKKPELKKLLDYYYSMIRKLGIDLNLGTEANTEIVLSYKPEKVYLATGSTPMSLKIPGGEKVKSGIEYLLTKNCDLGENICVIGGSGVGIDIAMYLAEKGKEVTIVEMLDDIGNELSSYLREHLKVLLRQNGINILTSHQVKEVTDKGIIVESHACKKEKEFDDILCAIGFIRNDVSYLENKLIDAGIEVNVIGASIGAGHIMQATSIGYNTAISI